MSESEDIEMIPEYLYHYTSVDTLALILQNRTIRFNSLNKMDDNLEQWSAHGVQEGKHVFISSWTDKSEEISGMWKTYCRPGPEVGVRIKLPVNPFSNSENKLPRGMEDIIRKSIVIMDAFVYDTLGVHTNGDYEEDRKLYQQASSKRPESKKKIDAIINEMTRSTVECHTRDLNKILFQVEYTNNPNKIFPWLYHKYEGHQFIDYSNYGKYKDLSWKWQHEWRYILHFRNVTPGIQHMDGSIDIYPIPFDYYDLILDSEKIKQMEITMSPVISDEEAKKLKQVVEQYNPSARICTSTLESLE